MDIIGSHLRIDRQFLFNFGMSVNDAEKRCPMTNQPERREPCPELAWTENYLVGFNSIGEPYHTGPDDLCCIYERDHVVPCLVTPLLTADEREKLIGRER